MKKFVYAALFAASLSYPTAAAADTVTLTSNGSAYGGTSVKEPGSRSPRARAARR